MDSVYRRAPVGKARISLLLTNQHGSNEIAAGRQAVHFPIARGNTDCRTIADTCQPIWRFF